MTWFYATHEIIPGGDFGPPRWRRVVLPAAGGLADQDALLIDTLEHLRGIFNAKLAVSPT